MALLDEEDWLELTLLEEDTELLLDEAALEEEALLDDTLLDAALLLALLPLLAAIRRLSRVSLFWSSVVQSSSSTPPVSPLFGFQDQ